MKDLNLVKDVTVTVHAHDVRFWGFTNADRIRAMSDEELACWICNTLEDETDDWLGWLKSPVEVDNGT